MVQITTAAGLDAHWSFGSRSRVRPQSDGGLTPLPHPTRPPPGGLHSQPGGGRLDDHASAPRTGLRRGPAGRGAGALRTRHLRTGHRRDRRPGSRGRELLDEMARLNIILDATHLCDDSFWEALDHFDGAVWASHNNCRALVPHNRQFSDEQIRRSSSGRRSSAAPGRLDDGARTGCAARRRREAPGLTLDRMIDHMDHICQLAGNARHVRHRVRSRRRFWHGANTGGPRHHRRPCPSARHAARSRLLGCRR